MGKLMKERMAKVRKTKAHTTEASVEAQMGKTQPKVEAEIAKVTARVESEVKVRAEKAKENVGESTGFKRSPCAVASTLDLIGDKWSLLVVRDLLHGKRTYGELADSPEGIPTNILAERLKRLESAGIISSAAYQERPVRYAYTLTEKGVALGDVLLSLVRWGKEYIPGTRTLREPE
jgi:DNA-binding HxlR family transcriptional regulator